MVLCDQVCDSAQTSLAFNSIVGVCVDDLGHVVDESHSKQPAFVWWVHCVHQEVGVGIAGGAEYHPTNHTQVWPLV